MLSKEKYVERFVDLIGRASTRLPEDVERALRQSRQAEEQGSLAQKALDTILANVDLARELSAPICQDTGTPVAWVKYPAWTSTRVLQTALEEAVREATQRQVLRPNAVQTLTGTNTGDGSGRGIPYVHFEEWDDPAVEVRMLLKGGGCENVGAQYKLPDSRLGAGRDLDQVRAIQFPVFTSSTICSHAYCHMLHIGLPVRVGGLIRGASLLMRPRAAEAHRVGRAR